MESPVLLHLCVSKQATNTSAVNAIRTSPAHWRVPCDIALCSRANQSAAAARRLTTTATGFSAGQTLWVEMDLYGATDAKTWCIHQGLGSDESSCREFFLQNAGDIVDVATYGSPAKVMAALAPNETVDSDVSAFLPQLEQFFEMKFNGGFAKDTEQVLRTMAPRAEMKQDDETERLIAFDRKRALSQVRKWVNERDAEVRESVEDWPSAVGDPAKWANHMLLFSPEQDLAQLAMILRVTSIQELRDALQSRAHPKLEGLLKSDSAESLLRAQNVGSAMTSQLLPLLLQAEVN